MLSRWLYYLSSIPTLLRGVRNWQVILPAFLGLRVRKPFLIELRRTGLRFKVRSAMDVWIIKEVCLDREYERGGVRPGTGSIVLDIGGGLGEFAIDVARRHPDAMVYCYEPCPDSFSLLRENLEINGVENVRARGLAVGGSAGPCVLRTGHTEAAQYSTAAPSDTLGADAIEVESTTLDEIMGELAPREPVLLKLDCEGAEYEILFHSGDETLSRIRHAIVEYHDGSAAWSHRDLVEFFERKGFRTELRPNCAHDHLGLLFAWNRRYE